MFRASFAAVLLVAISVSACRPGGGAAPAVSADTWATVNGRNITAADVDKAYKRGADPAATLSPEELQLTKLGLLDDLITQDLLLAKAMELMLDAVPADVDKAFAEAKGALTDEQFNAELTKRGMTAADVRESLRRDLVVQKVFEQQVTSKVVVADQEVTDFFNTNKAQFNLTEDSYRLAQIIVTPVPEGQQVNASGDDAKTPQEMTAKVARLMQQLQMGANFAELARNFSEDAQSAQAGGDLGLVPLSAVRQADAPLRNAVLNTTPGNARVVTQGGAMAIVLVMGMEKAGQRDLATPGTKEQITQVLRARREQLLRNAYLAAMRTDADITNYAVRRVVETNGKI